MDDNVKQLGVVAGVGAAIGVGLALGLGLRIVAMSALLGVGLGAALGVATALKGREGDRVLLIPSEGHAALH